MNLENTSLRFCKFDMDIALIQTVTSIHTWIGFGSLLMQLKYYLGAV
jgi:hypothetical protein